MFYENKRELFLLFCEKNPIQFPLHLHQYLELVRIERGCVEMQIGSKKYLLQQGDLAFIFPNIPHDYHTLSGTSDTELHILNCYPTYLPLHTTVLMNNYPKNPVLRAEEIHPYILYAEKRLYEIHQDDYDQILISSLLSLMLSRIFPKLILSDIKEAPQGDLSNEIITYIGKHFREEISLSTIAKHFGIGKCTLSRIFSNVLKVSFSTYINSLRIDYADHLLMTTDLGMMEISIECGYHNQQTFYRLFKTYHKCTPKEYRKEHRLRPVLALPPYTEVYEPQYGQESFTK